MTQETLDNATDDLVFPQEIGAAVVAHCVYEVIGGRPSPNPNDPQAVLDVSRTIINHTGLEPHVVAGHIPAIKELLGELQSSLAL